MGFSYTTLSHPPQSAKQGFMSGLERIVEDAISSTEVISPDLYYDFAPVLKNPPSHLPIYDEALEGTSEKSKVEKAKQLEEAARSVDPESKR
jgi:predicted Zn-dependent protease